MVLNHSCIRWIGICHCLVTAGENLFSKVYSACAMRRVCGIFLSLQVGYSVSVLTTCFTLAVLILLLLFSAQNQLAKDCPVVIFAL